MTNMIPVTYRYAKASKTDRDENNLETQLQRSSTMRPSRAGERRRRLRHDV